MKSRLTASISAHPVRWGWLLCALFSTVVAAIMSLALEGGLVCGYFIVSYGIGFSVPACIHLGVAFGPTWLPRAVVGLVMATCGLIIGLAASGVLVAGNPALLLGDRVSVLTTGLVWALAGIGFEALRQVWNARGRLDQAERDRLTRDKTRVEAELRVLQAQVEPHFLFNSLANVRSLIRRHPDRAARLLERLTSLLRVSLSRTRRAAGTLGDELAVVRAYLDMQALRMAGRMTYDVQVDPGLESVSMPALLVQPLVEDAVRHGIEPSAAGGCVVVRAEGDGDSLRIRVTDNGVGGRPGTAGCAGVASVRERLRVLFGDRGRLVLTEMPEGGGRADLRIPRAIAAGRARATTVQAFPHRSSPTPGPDEDRPVTPHPDGSPASRSAGAKLRPATSFRSIF